MWDPIEDVQKSLGLARKKGWMDPDGVPYVDEKKQKKWAERNTW